MPPPKRRVYETPEDTSLNKKQATTGAFSTGAGNFRSPSNPTLQGYRSGYHEAALTTDTWNFLKKAQPQYSHSGPPTHTDKHRLPGSAPQNSYFEQWTGQWVYSKTLEWVLRAGDGFRTDTAQTIISAEEGLPAGHTGSDLSLTRQSEAHDLLRAKIMELLRVDPKTVGLTEASIHVIMGAMTVASIAPGEIARKLAGGTASLKAGKPAKKKWEENRTEAKLRVRESFDLLTPDEQAFTNAHARSFLDSTQENVPSLKRRRMGPRATSPLRETAISLASPGEVAGGGYLATEPSLQARKATPMSKPGRPLAGMGMFVTESLRGERQVIP